MAKDTAGHYGVFTRDNAETGEKYERRADSPADAVKFTFDGWKQSAEATAKTAQPAGAGPDATGDVAGDSTSSKAKTTSR